MATERSGYEQFLALKTEQEKYAALAAIINRNADKALPNEWDEKDADVILQLASLESKTVPANFSLLDDYLESPEVFSQLKAHQAPALFHKLKAPVNAKEENSFIKDLRAAFTPAADSGDELDSSDEDAGLLTRTGARATKALAATASAASVAGRGIKIAGIATGHFLWKDRNRLQRAGLVLSPLALTATVLGAVSAKSAALTTAGNFAAHLLPHFVTAFGTAHAIPPAAIAFYVIGAALGVVALALLLAGTVKQCAENRKLGRATYLPVEPLLVTTTGTGPTRR